MGGANIWGNASNSSQVTINAGKLANTSSSGRTIPSPIPLNMNGDFTVDDSLTATPGQILFNGPITIKNSNRTITVSGAGNLGLGGVVGQDVSGRSLTKDGAGILALTNAANTYSGDTTILAGQLNVDADGSLGDGTGTLHISGGKINATASRTVATPNPVDLTADSAITTSSAAATPQFEFSSDSIGGSAGTLTLRNDGADAATDQLDVRFSGGGFTFSRPIVIDNGSTGKTRMSSFNVNPTGQTFAGSISGNGSYNRSASAGNGGTTVFTAINSYSGGTVVHDGMLDIQSDGGLGSGNVQVDANGILTLEMARPTVTSMPPLT